MEFSTGTFRIKNFWHSMCLWGMIASFLWRGATFTAIHYLLSLEYSLSLRCNRELTVSNIFSGKTSLIIISRLNYCLYFVGFLHLAGTTVQNLTFPCKVWESTRLKVETHINNDDNSKSPLILVLLSSVACLTSILRWRLTRFPLSTSHSAYGLPRSRS